MRILVHTSENYFLTGVIPLISVRFIRGMRKENYKIYQTTHYYIYFPGAYTGLKQIGNLGDVR